MWQKGCFTCESEAPLEWCERHGGGPWVGTRRVLQAARAGLCSVHRAAGAAPTVGWASRGVRSPQAESGPTGPASCGSRETS